MSIRRLLILVAMVVSVAPLVRAEVKASQIEKQLKNLRSLSEAQRPAATTSLAADIRSLPAGSQKVEYADELAHLVTEGDQGKGTLQAVADTLAGALTETPIPSKNNKAAAPYYDLASLVRYENVNATVDNPSFAEAAQSLAADDAAVADADFTLKDLKGKSFTLSALRGKIVLVNFWASWCAPCRQEMAALDSLQQYFQAQGLVVLSITDEDARKIGRLFANYNYHPAILFDVDGSVHKKFRITGIPRTFVFGRDGKLLGVAIDQRTSKQFLEMLAKTDLHP